jgi:hypothetical protein
MPKSTSWCFMRDFVLVEPWLLRKTGSKESSPSMVLVNCRTGEAFGPNDIVEASEELGGVQCASTLIAWLIISLPPDRHDAAREFLLQASSLGKAHRN